MPTIEGHHDFGVLEARLVTLVREVPREDRAPLPPPVAIIAPTRRLLMETRLVLAGKAPALLNLHFFHHHSLARAALVAAGRPVPDPLSDDVRAALVARLVAAQGGPLAVYARSRPGCIASVLSTLDDLREAGVPPDAPSHVKGLTERGRELLRIHAAYARALDAATPALCDRARFLLQAAPAVRDYARRFRLVVHYGAYDLIGVNLELMRAVEASGARVVFLAPHHPSSRAYEMARRFWPEFLAAQPSPLPGAATDRLLADRLPLLYEEGAEPGPLDDRRRARVSFFHAQGAAAELREVALRVLALHRDEGVPLHRIVVVARSLEPYASMLRPAFEEHGLPFDTTASLGALREARVQAALQLARTLLRDFPRQSLMDLCRGGLLRLRDHDPARDAHTWDRLSRDWHVAGGRSAWTRDLIGWVADWQPYVPAEADEDERKRARSRKSARTRQAGALASLVETLERAGRPLLRARTWTAWADEMESLLIDLLDGFAAPPTDEAISASGGTVLGVLSEMRRLDAAGVPCTGPEALSFFEQAIARARVPLGGTVGAARMSGGDHGGVRVLDAMQARGLAFDAVFLIGFNADLFPRRATEDPFLPDADRRLLRDGLRLPLPVKTTALEEERLLLAHLLGSARERLTVSWQRADEAGRARVASLALREIARLVDGAPDLGRIEAGALRVLAHPAEAGLDALTRFGMLPPQDACVQAALQARTPRALLHALPRRLLPAPESTLEALRPGLAMLLAVDEFAPADLSYDAFVGSAVPPPPHVSPSRLEVLGACPQHYFFRHVLFVEELDEVREAYEFDGREMGSRVHAVLHDVFEGLLLPDGSLPGGEGGDRERRAIELARTAWARHTRDLAARTAARYPLLWQATETLWLQAIGEFLRDDLAALALEGVRVVGLERQECARISLGAEGRGFDVRGRFDRLAAAPAGLVVADYKTSGRIERHVSPAQILKGMSLQLPLYLLLLQALADERRVDAPAQRADILGVGPAFMTGPGGDDASREVAPGRRPHGGGTPARVSLDMSTLTRHREGLLETLGVLHDLAATGSYPLNSESWLCDSCPYRRACRRWHVPTVARVVSAPTGRDYALLRRKSSRKPLLEQIRGTADSGEDA